MPFMRYCKHCGKKFQPETRCQHLCRDCYKKVRSANFIKMLVHRKNMSELKKLNKIN